MPDGDQTDVPVPMPDTAPAVVRREVQRKDLVETFVVHDHGRRYEVAANLLAHKAQQQMTAGRLFALCEKTIKEFEESGAAPSPKDLKILVDACEVVGEMGDAAYGESKKGGQLGNALERLAYGLTRGAVEAGKKATNSPEARLNRLSRVGKGAAKVIDVTPKPEDLDT